jgi:hypothetical protein
MGIKLLYGRPVDKIPKRIEMITDERPEGKVITKYYSRPMNEMKNEKKEMDLIMHDGSS